MGPKVEDHSKYVVDSAFNVQTDFGDSPVGAQLDMLRDMSDHPDDPGRYVVERVTEFLPWPLDSAAEPLIDELGPDVNAIIVGRIPVTDEIKALAEGLSNVARVFEVRSFLDVGLDANGRYTASHQLTSMHFGFAGLSLDLTGAELGELAPTERIAVQLLGDNLVIPAHQLPLPMGPALREAVDMLVVPTIAADAAGFADLMIRWFACEQIAGTIADSIGGGRDTVLEACADATMSASDKLLAKTLLMDGDSGLQLAGQATFDATTGLWTGGGWSGVYRLGDGSQAGLDPSTCVFDMTVVPAE